MDASATTSKVVVFAARIDELKTGVWVIHYGTVAIRDAGSEPTGTYLQRVPEGVTHTPATTIVMMLLLFSV